MNRSSSPAPVETTLAIVQNSNRLSGLTRGETFLAGERVEMERGRAVFRFASGAKFAVEAPAAFTITDANGAHFDFGRATVRVPGEIKGFTLVTPTETVIDLGTAFGIEVTESGATSVAVFKRAGASSRHIRRTIDIKRAIKSFASYPASRRCLAAELLLAKCQR